MHTTIDVFTIGSKINGYVVKAIRCNWAGDGYILLAYCLSDGQWVTARYNERSLAGGEWWSGRYFPHSLGAHVEALKSFNTR